MSKKNKQEEIIDAINEIMDGLTADNKTATLIRQRGYLTGWLARLAHNDWIIRDEVMTRLEQTRSKKTD